MRGNRYYQTIATINSPTDNTTTTRSGYCSAWSWAQASSHQRGGGRSINVYNASNQNMISRGVLRGPAPLSLHWGVARAPLADVFVGRRGGLWLWWPSSLALRRWLPRRALLRGDLGLRWKNHEGSVTGRCMGVRAVVVGGKDELGRTYFRRPPPFPLLASRWGNFGRGGGCVRSILLVLAALGTTTTSLRRWRCDA